MLIHTHTSFFTACVIHTHIHPSSLPVWKIHRNKHTYACVVVIVCVLFPPSAVGWIWEWGSCEYTHARAHTHTHAHTQIYISYASSLPVWNTHKYTHTSLCINVVGAGRVLFLPAVVGWIWGWGPCRDRQPAVPCHCVWDLSIRRLWYPPGPGSPQFSRDNCTMRPAWNCMRGGQ